MEDLPEALVVEIIKRITCTNDLNSLSLVSKRLHTVEAEQRGAILVPSSHCTSLTDLTLSFCSYIDDSGLGYLACCKKLTSLRLNSLPAISSSGLFSVAVGCKSLSALHLIHCKGIIGSVEWLEYLGRDGSLEELVVRKRKGISQYDLLKFASGWMKLQKFEFEIKGGLWNLFGKDRDPSYVVHYPYVYDFRCENLKDLRLASTTAEPEIGHCFLLGKCKALEKLCLEYVYGLSDSNMIVLFQSCINLRSISLWLHPRFYDDGYRTAFTDECLKDVFGWWNGQGMEPSHSNFELIQLFGSWYGRE